MSQAPIQAPTPLTKALIDGSINSVKSLKPALEKKTPGTVAVEKHRPLLNKLTEAQRRALRERAAGLLYGHEAPAPGR